MGSVPPTHFSPQTEKEIADELNLLYNVLRSASLQNAQKFVNATVYPAIDNSPYIIAKYPNPLHRTEQNVLGGLSDVVDIEYLNTLPTDDSRRHFLATIQDPGPERRAELIENLRAIDAERGEDAREVSTYSLYQQRSREGIDENLVYVLNNAVRMETLRRKRAEYSEYGRQEWHASNNAEELQQFIKTCYEDTEHGEPPRNYTVAELRRMNTNLGISRSLLNTYFDNVIYPAIYDSPIIAEKYPNLADRTPHKLLGGLANIISIEYMQSLEPHDPRRLFLDTLTAPDEQRCIELEMNALLVDRAVTKRQQYEPGEFSVRVLLLRVVREALEENYLSTLTSAVLGEQMRRYGNNNGVEKEDPYGEIAKKGALKKVL